MHPQALDCTLLIAHYDDIYHRLHIALYGDGFIHIKQPNGDEKILSLEFTSGAPFYLSYELDENRRNGYLTEFADDPRIASLEWATSGSQFGELDKPFKSPQRWEDCRTLDGKCYFGHVMHSIFSNHLTPGTQVTLMSDGVKQFRKADGSYIDYHEVIKNLTTFANTTGRFAARRLGAYQRKCNAEGIDLMDDVSISSIII